MEGNWIPYRKELGAVDKKRYCKKLVFCFVGSVLMGIGNGIAINCGLGADPITVFYGGVVHTMKISARWASNLTALLMIAITVFLDYHELGVGTVLSLFVVGGFMDVTIGLLKGFSWAFPYNYILMLVAFTILAAGAGAIIYVGVGKVAYDALLIAITKKSGHPYHHVRWAVDFFLLATGILMGGTLTVGTVVAFLILGKMITFFWRAYEKCRWITL